MGGLKNTGQFYLIDVIYGAQNTSLGLAPVAIILEGEGGQTSASASDLLRRRSSGTLTSALSTTTNSSTNLCTPALGVDF